MNECVYAKSQVHLRLYTVSSIDYGTITTYIRTGVNHTTLPPQGAGGSDQSDMVLGQFLDA